MRRLLRQRLGALRDAVRHTARQAPQPERRLCLQRFKRLVLVVALCRGCRGHRHSEDAARARLPQAERHGGRLIGDTPYAVTAARCGAGGAHEHCAAAQRQPDHAHRQPVGRARSRQLRRRQRSLLLPRRQEAQLLVITPVTNRSSRGLCSRSRACQGRGRRRHRCVASEGAATAGSGRKGRAVAAVAISAGGCATSAPSAIDDSPAACGSAARAALGSVLAAQRRAHPAADAGPRARGTSDGGGAAHGRGFSTWLAALALAIQGGGGRRCGHCQHVPDAVTRRLLDAAGAARRRCLCGRRVPADSAAAAHAAGACVRCCEQLAAAAQPAAPA
mmetsp:Transcript_2638/g.7865  ORF Transcript_2638/g.7865 Transcript_2638/m.7865 type:complete len:333 (-) Transcript_2638:187-1185(-)